MSLLPRLSVIVADLAVLIATWVRTAGIYREASRVKLRVPLVAMLLRDGERLPLLSCKLALTHGSQGTVYFLCGDLSAMYSTQLS